MPSQDAHAGHPTVDTVFGAIADWINKYRHAMADPAFERCDADEVKRIAADLGMPSADLRLMARKGPGAAALLEKMLLALHVDPDALANANPAVLRDLQRLCTSCTVKGRCQHELAAGTAAAHFREFCPNAFTLDALFRQNARQTH